MTNTSSRLWHELDRLTVIASIAFIVILSAAYFGLSYLDPAERSGWGILHRLSLDVITDIIPVFVLFIGSYFVYRRIQQIRSDEDRSQLVAQITQSVDDAVRRIIKEPTDFLQHDYPTSYSDDLSEATEIWAVSVRLSSLFQNYYEVLENRLESGARLRLLAINPDSAAYKMALARSHILGDPDHERSTALNNLELASRLWQRFPKLMEIRLIDHPLTFEATVFNPELDHGVIYVRHYAYKTRGGAKPIMRLAKRESEWCAFYSEEVELLWHDAVPWTGENPL